MRVHKKNKFRKNLKHIVAIAMIALVIFIIRTNVSNKDNVEETNTIKTVYALKIDEKKQLEWNLTLANSENPIPKDYKITLESIDEYRKFDSRAINYLKNMLNDMRKEGITNIWVQSSYRSVEDQTRIYNNKVQEYKNKGKSEENAKKLTEEVINKPGCSDHNLGLGVDFNYVKEDFEDTQAYKWLIQNAEDYGFVLRYPKSKENITKVNYEPWHWRFVGIDDAKKMNELKMCLEEYVEYLSK